MYYFKRLKIMKKLSNFNFADEASLDKFCRDKGWTLERKEGNLKVRFNALSEAHIINRFSLNKISAECPPEICIYLQSVGFDVDSF